ncbi:MAG: hypothetical protein ACTSSB_13340 [Candidatus Heimdallarchaeota archaeon]
MAYVERNRLLQTILGILAGALLIAFNIGIYSVFEFDNDIVQALVPFFLFLFFMLLAGLITGTIAYRKDSYKIMAIFVPLAMLGDFVYLIVLFLISTNSIGSDVDLSYLLAFLKILPGAIFVFIGCFLGILIKYKVQKDANFTIDLLDKIKAKK